MNISDAEYDGTKVIACKLDGQAVIHCDKTKYDFVKWWDVVSRVVAGGLIGNSFSRVFGRIGGAVTGLASAFWNDVREVGYYTPSKTLVCQGTIYLRENGQHDLIA